MRVITVLAVAMACIAIIGTHAMTDEEAEGVMSGRIRDWPAPSADSNSHAMTDEEAEGIMSGRIGEWSAHAMSDADAEGIMSGRIREWPVRHAMSEQEAADILAGRSTRDFEADEEADAAEQPQPPTGRELASNATTEADASAENEYQVRIVSDLGAGASCGCGVSATMANEGTRACCYFDSVGIPTIGVGHNLRSGPAALKKYGLNPSTVVSTCGKYTSYKAGYCLTSAQISDLFSIDFAPSRSCAKSVAPNAPACVSAALADMAFNLGCAGLKSFSTTLSNVNSKKWAAAATSIGQSLYCKQVGGRCARNQACIRSGL